MSSIIGDLIDSIMSRLSSSSKQKPETIDRDTLRQSVEDSLGVHQCLVEVLTSVDSKRLKEWMQTRVDQALRTDNSVSKDAYYTYLRSLDSRLKKIETDVPFSSLVEANKIYVSFLTDVLKNFDTLVEKQTLTIYDFKLSLAGLCGYLDKSKLICDFSSYLFAYLVRTGGGISRDIPKYRGVYLMDRAEFAAKIISETVSEKNELKFIGNVKNARSKFSDLEFSQNGAFTSDKAKFIESQGDKNLFDPFTTAALIAGAQAIGKFVITAKGAAIIGTTLAILSKGFIVRNYNRALMWNHNRKQETREWLQQHVGLLRLQLAELDPSSPEFAKLESIIKAYDDDIADYDRDIAEFEAEVLNS